MRILVVFDDCTRERLAFVASETFSSGLKPSLRLHHLRFSTVDHGVWLG
jgi:hypothetical protein